MKSRKNILIDIVRSIYTCIRHVIIDWKIKILVHKYPRRVVIGASGVYQRGWIPTDIEHLNILKNECWNKYFMKSSIDAILAEHVLEHLTLEECDLSAKNCHKYLKSNGYIRVAVPDGYHPSKEYINHVRPGGTGCGSSDHKVLFNYKTLVKVFEDNGYLAMLLEYYDEKGIFHFKPWDPKMGMITRSKRYDDRNSDGKLNYTSIVMDAKKLVD